MVQLDHVLVEGMTFEVKAGRHVGVQYRGRHDLEGMANPNNTGERRAGPVILIHRVSRVYRQTVSVPSTGQVPEPTHVISKVFENLGGKTWMPSHEC